MAGEQFAQPGEGATRFRAAPVAMIAVVKADRRGAVDGQPGFGRRLGQPVHGQQQKPGAVGEGVLALIEAARTAGLKLAIATTTSPVNIAALLRAAIGQDWRQIFAVVEDASTAPRKKPHPQVYRQTLQRLGLPAQRCLAFEDSANGLQAANAAGLATVVTPNTFTAHHDFAGALRVLPSLAGVTLADLQSWHAATLAQPAAAA